MRSMVACAALLLALGACGGHSIDVDAWRSDLNDAGVSDPDMAKLQALYEDSLCKDSDDELEAFAAVSMDRGSDLDVVRISFRHACPDKLDDFEEAVTGVQDSSDAVEEACALSPSARSEEQERLAEAMGC